jgi:hypothetical protein
MNKLDMKNDGNQLKIYFLHLKLVMSTNHKRMQKLKLEHIFL